MEAAHSTTPFLPPRMFESVSRETILDAMLVGEWED